MAAGPLCIHDLLLEMMFMYRDCTFRSESVYTMRHNGSWPFFVFIAAMIFSGGGGRRSWIERAPPQQNIQYRYADSA